MVPLVSADPDTPLGIRKTKGHRGNTARGNSEGMIWDRWASRGFMK